MGIDPAKKRFVPEEGTAGAKLEQALGRTISRSLDPAADFVDAIHGPISLKGPIPTNGSLDGLARSIIKDAMGGNTATKTLVVDTSGLSERQVSQLKSAIQAGTKGTKKRIIYL